MLGRYHTVDATAGCECTGVETGVGAGVTEEGNIEVGDRASAAIMGMNPLQPVIGPFAQNSFPIVYCSLKLPAEWSFTNGSGIGNARYTRAAHGHCSTTSDWFQDMDFNRYMNRQFPQ